MKYKTTIKLLAFIFFFFLSQLNSQTKIIQGIVIDIKTNDPLKDVVVIAVDTVNVVCAMQNTDSVGVFILTGIKHKKIKIRTYRFGYAGTTTGPYNLASHDTLKMLIRLEAIPFTLNEAVVTAKKIDTYLEKVHFYDRKKMGMGHFVTRDDFKDRGLYNIYDLFRHVPGVIVRKQNLFLSCYSGASIGATAPQPSIYVDRILMPDQDDNIGWLSPESVLAVEVYNGITAPAEYSRGMLGGVILIWTRY